MPKSTPVEAGSVWAEPGRTSVVSPFAKRRRGPRARQRASRVELTFRFFRVTGELHVAVGGRGVEE